MAILLRPPVPRAPIRKGVSGFEVWEETRKRGRQQEDPAASSRGGLSGKAPHYEPPGGNGPLPAGLGAARARKQGLLLEAGPEAGPKGSPGREGSDGADAASLGPWGPGLGAPHRRCPRAGAVRGAEARRLRTARGEGAVPSHDLCPRSGVRGAVDSLGEAVRGGEDPPVRDEAAPAEVASVSLNADLPGPLALQGILPAHHPVQHPRAAAGWRNRAEAGVGGAPWRPIPSGVIPTPKPTLKLSYPVHSLAFLSLTHSRTLGLSRRPGHQSASDSGLWAPCPSPVTPDPLGGGGEITRLRSYPTPPA